MIFSSAMLVHFAIFVLGVSGFFLSKYIYNKKRQGNPLVCPVRFDCNTVVNSDYSRILGIPVEILGMVYYVFIALSHFLFLVIPNSSPQILILFMVIASFLAFLFSIYLIGVQVFVLKKGCSWCFVSAFLCILIFIFTLSIYDISLLLQFFR